MNDNQKVFRDYLMKLSREEEASDVLQLGYVFGLYVSTPAMPLSVRIAYESLSSTEINTVVNEIAMMSLKK